MKLKGKDLKYASQGATSLDLDFLRGLPQSWVDLPWPIG